MQYELRWLCELLDSCDGGLRVLCVWMWIHTILVVEVHCTAVRKHNFRQIFSCCHLPPQMDLTSCRQQPPPRSRPTTAAATPKTLTTTSQTRPVAHRATSTPTPTHTPQPTAASAVETLHSISPSPTITQSLTTPSLVRQRRPCLRRIQPLRVCNLPL